MGRWPRSLIQATTCLGNGRRVPRDPRARRVWANAVTEGKNKAHNMPANRKSPIWEFCLGMQMAVSEAAAYVAGLTTAGSEEFDHESAAKSVLKPVSKPPQGNGCRATHKVEPSWRRTKAATMRLGAKDATLKKDRTWPYLWHTSSTRVTVTAMRSRHPPTPRKMEKPSDLSGDVARRHAARDRGMVRSPVVHCVQFPHPD